MQGYLSQVRHLKSGFEFFSLLHIPRSGNTHTDSLATIATSSTQNLPWIILVEDLYKPTEVKREVVHVHQVRVRSSWMDPMVLFLNMDILPEEKSEVDKIRRKAPRFWLSKDQKLYKCFFFWAMPTMHMHEASELLIEELHEGICGSHTGGRSLSHQTIT